MNVSEYRRLSGFERALHSHRPETVPHPHRPISVIIKYTVFIIYRYILLHIAQFHTTPGVQDSYDQAERDLVTSGIDGTAGASSSRGTPAAFGLGV